MEMTEEELGEWIKNTCPSERSNIINNLSALKTSEAKR